MTDVLGHAIHDYYYNLSPGKLLIHNKFGKPDEMPVKLYFREEEDMPELELEALHLCTGKVLDIGAGAGSHTLLLQERNVDVTALEISPLAAAVMKNRGVSNIIAKDIFEHTGHAYNTLLLLMNGIGLVADIAGLRRFLQQVKTLILPGGQLIFDSSNVAYLYKGKPPAMDNYYGEISFRYEYKKQKTSWFTWLYIDQDLLAKIAGEEGWLTTVVYEDGHDQYLARLTQKPIA